MPAIDHSQVNRYKPTIDSELVPDRGAVPSIARVRDGIQNFEYFTEHTCCLHACNINLNLQVPVTRDISFVLASSQNI